MREYEERGVPRCQVHFVVVAHPSHPEWQPLEFKETCYRAADTQETTALRALIAFCAHHPNVI